MKQTMVRIGVTVMAVIACGLTAGSAAAEDAPAFLKQTATITDWSVVPEGHEHPKLSGSKKAGKEFKVNRRAFQDVARYIDVKWSIFDPLQKSDLVTIYTDAHPLSSDSFEFIKPCHETNLLKCIKVKPFPIALGIQMLENADTSVTPHAYIYVPARLKEETPKAEGDTFWLAIRHIPDNDGDCAYPHLEAEKRLCTALREQVKEWYPDLSADHPDGKRDYAHLTDLAKAKFDWFLEHIFDGYCVPNPDNPPDPNSGCAPTPSPFIDPSGPKVDVMGAIHLLFGIKSHNEIVHGSLK